MEAVLRGVAIYFILLIVMRFSGRRTLAQMTSFDFVLLLIIAETTQQALLGDDFSITNAAIVIVVLFSLDIALSYVKEWAPRVGLVLDGSATVLIADGKSDHHAIKRARVDLNDILTAAREQQALERLDQVRFAILEPDGGISIIPKPSA